MKNKFSMAISLAVILAMVLTAFAFADQVANNLDVSVDSNFETMALDVGGQNGSTILRIIEQNGDGKNGCNLQGSNKQLTVSITSSNLLVATVSPASITFSDCNDVSDTTVTVTPVGTGSADITLSLVSFTTNTLDVTSSSFDLLPGSFTVNVAPPPNSAPVVTVTGVTHGASYEFGTVPIAGCSVHDDEDGDSVFAASLSSISGALSEYGLGTQTATCYYKDEGGIDVTVEATYELVDTTGPTITYVNRTPATNSNDWNNTSVTVNWSCSDNVGVVNAAVSQTVSTEGADQSATGTCTDLVGLTASDTQSGINIDKQAPTTKASADVAPNENGWNNTDVTVSYSCTDNGPAGLDNAASDLGYDVLSASGTASGTCVDKAGNSASASYTAQIDKDDPEFSCNIPADVWYGDDVTVNCTAEDGGSGLAGSFDDSFSLSTNVDDDTETDSAQTGTKTLADKAGNSIEVGPYTFKVDKKAPEVSCGSADGNWHADNQSISCTAIDGGSGPVLQGTTLSTNVGTGNETENAYTGTHEFSDAVGNKSTAGPVGPFKIDRKAPSVSATPDRSADFSGWYNHALTMTFSGMDGGSGNVICADPVNYSGPDDDTASVSGSCADAVGNSASASFDFKYDGSYPTAALSVTAGTLGANGWYTSNVTVHTSGTGSVSGVTCTPDQFQNTETTGTVFNGSCTSGAGLTTDADPLTIKLDKTSPTAVLSASGTLGLNDWYISDVTITTSGTDTISTPVTCTASQSQVTDTTGAIFNGSCTNGAGLTTVADALTIKRDATTPTISASISPTRPLSGWWNITSGAPTVTYTCLDATSLIASCTAPYLFLEDVDQSHIGTATDNAGNMASTSVNDIDVDLTAPTLTWDSGVYANSASFYFGFVPAWPPNPCVAGDLLSGPASCGVIGNSMLVGTHTLTATALDVAGNSKVETRTYTVMAWTLKGFYQPVDMNGIWNTVKNGSTVPLKFEIFAGATELMNTSAVVGFDAEPVTCNNATADDIEVLATGGTSLRYDTTGGQFIFNWQTPKKVGACYKITMTTQDGSTLSALFKLK